MSEQHKVTPPPELVQQWRREWMIGNGDRDSYQNIATQAARWGADQELEACCEWLESEGRVGYAVQLRAARRLGPPSLKEQSLELIDLIQGSTKAWHIRDLDVVRYALQQLPG